MWTDEDFTRSGGFDVSGYSQSPTAAPETKTSRRPSSIFPLTIKQIVEAKDDVIQINGLPVTMIRIVAIVKSIEMSSTKIIFQLEDWSGEILGMLWLENNGDDQKPAGVIENTYVQVSGTKRNQNGKNVLFIYNIVPVTDLSQITHHYLQVIHIQLKSEERRQAASLGYGEGDTNDTTVHSGMTPLQSKVYNVIKQAKSEAGMNKTEILSLVKIPPTEVDKAVEFLITEGHVYCTIDDDHFRVTDG